MMLKSIKLMFLAALMGVAIFWPLTTTAYPVTNKDLYFEPKQRCSEKLSEAIDSICNGRTRSLLGKYPESFGRAKRTASPEEIFYKPLQNGPTHECCRKPCGYYELSEYCAPD